MVHTPARSSANSCSPVHCSCCATAPSSRCATPLSSATRAAVSPAPAAALAAVAVAKAASGCLDRAAARTRPPVLVCLRLSVVAPPGPPPPPPPRPLPLRRPLRAPRAPPPKRPRCRRCVPRGRICCWARRRRTPGPSCCSGTVARAPCPRRPPSVCTPTATAASTSARWARTASRTARIFRRCWSAAARWCCVRTRSRASSPTRR
mmetsp:Transcript_14024/g.42228  ORF Transcript_14024/g.42228 Transcript_14024/m.42228 type:complete len:206 (-) Transcript_14024:1024-1641(-)